MFLQKVDLRSPAANRLRATSGELRAKAERQRVSVGQVVARRSRLAARSSCRGVAWKTGTPKGGRTSALNPCNSENCEKRSAKVLQSPPDVVELAQKLAALPQSAREALAALLAAK